MCPRSSTIDFTTIPPVASTAMPASTTAAQAATAVGSVAAITISARIHPPTHTASHTSNVPNVFPGATDHDVCRFGRAASAATNNSGRCSYNRRTPTGTPGANTGSIATSGRSRQHLE